MEGMTKITMDGDRSFDFLCAVTVAGSSIQLSQSVILYLEIRESIFNGFPEGVMLLDNNSGIIDSIFSFNGNNAVDLITFYIKQEDIDREDNFAIQEVFSIYKVEDVPIGEVPLGAKRIYFRNTLANELRTKKNSLTVFDFFPDTDLSNLSDNERAVKTGTILKKLFGKDDKPVGDIPRTGDFKISEKEWDEGKYSMYPNWCPGTETLFDSIQKIYLKHISAEKPYDKCYLKYNRFSKELSLISIRKLLMKNKEDNLNYFLENLVMGTLTSGEEGDLKSVAETNNIPKPKVFSADTLIDLSNIRSFKFIDLSAEILERDLTINLPVTVGFDNSTRIDLGEKNTKDIFEEFKQYYVKDPFNHMVEGGEAMPSMMWETTRKKITTQYNKVILTPYKSWDHAFDIEVRANTLNTFLLKGLNCTLSLRGSTHRTIGKFIDIELRDSAPTNKFSKIPGRWLVTECAHIFTKDKYWNSLNCIKTYRNF